MVPPGFACASAGREARVVFEFADNVPQHAGKSIEFGGRASPGARQLRCLAPRIQKPEFRSQKRRTELAA